MDYARNSCIYLFLPFSRDQATRRQSPHSGLIPNRLTSSLVAAISVASRFASSAGCAGDDLVAGAVRLRARLGRLERRLALARQQRDDLGRRSGRRKQRVEGVGDEAREARTRSWSARPAARTSASAPVTASALNLPSLISGSTGASATEPTCTVPSSTAMVAGPPPRYGMCTMSMPARSLSCSAARCDLVPTPGLA